MLIRSERLDRLLTNAGKNESKRALAKDAASAAPQESSYLSHPEASCAKDLRGASTFHAFFRSRFSPGSTGWACGSLLKEESALQ